jgi:uncharacterized protein YdeI (BOF family)
MKKIHAAILVMLTIVTTLVLAGCSAERYGKGVDKGVSIIKVKDVFLTQDIAGKRVTLQGQISSQCGSNGCWFVLQDDTGQVFVNLAPNNMTVPPRMNKKALVTGIVYPVQDQLQIIAEGVEVR